MGRAAIVITLLGLWPLPTAALAHGVHLSARVQDATIRGKVHLHGDLPSEGVKVTAYGPDDQPLAETTTDAQGAFEMSVEFHPEIRLVADMGDGHGGQQTIRLGEQSSEREMDLRYMFGAIGYIAGLAGVAFYFLGVRRKRALAG